MRRQVFSVERIKDFLSETVRDFSARYGSGNAWLGIESAGFDIDLLSFVATMGLLSGSIGTCTDDDNEAVHAV